MGEDMERDSAGHLFDDVDNIRITYIPAADRSPEADWAGSDVLRIQSYRGSDTGALSGAVDQGGNYPDTGGFLGLADVQPSQDSERGRVATVLKRLHPDSSEVIRSKEPQHVP